MGLADATDLFEICIHQFFQDLEGVLNIADDILVFGRTEQEFNTNVIKFLDHCVDEDIHLNADKVRINTEYLSLVTFSPKKEFYQMNPRSS